MASIPLSHGFEQSPFMMSYREKGSKSSRFVNINDLIENKDKKQLLKIYQHFHNNIWSYISACPDRKAIKKLSAVNDRMHIALRELLEDKGKVNQLINHTLNPKADIDRLRKNVNHQLKIALSKEIRVDLPLEVKEVMAKRLENVDEEFERLMEMERFANYIKKNAKKDVKIHKRLFVSIGHSMELQERVKDNYYVINHGQSNSYAGLNLATTYLLKLLENQNIEGQHAIRHKTGGGDKIHKIAKDFDKALTLTSEQNISNLISADIYLESTADVESAFYFALKNLNVALINAQSEIPELTKNVLQSYFKDKAIVKKLYNELVKIAETSKLNTWNQAGYLYTFLVPKNIFDSVAYISLPGSKSYNIPVTHHHLEQIQSGVNPKEILIPDKNLIDKIRFLDQPNPQVRLDANMLVRDLSILILPNSNLPPEANIEMESRILTAIEKARASFRVEKFPRKKERQLINTISKRHDEIAHQKLKASSSYPSNSALTSVVEDEELFVFPAHSSKSARSKISRSQERDSSEDDNIIHMKQE